MDNGKIRPSVRKRPSSCDISTLARLDRTARMTLDKVDKRNRPPERAVDADLVGGARRLDQHAIGRAEHQLLDNGVGLVPADHCHRRPGGFGGKIDADG